MTSSTKYSPKPPNTQARPGATARCEPALWTIQADCAAITLVLCFFAPQDPFQPLIAVRHSRCFFLTLRQGGLEGLVQGDGLVDLGTGSSTVGAETDQFLHTE